MRRVDLKTTLAVILLFYAATIVDENYALCPDGWDHDDNANSCLKLVESKSSFETMNDKCQSLLPNETKLGLVAILNNDTNKFICDHMGMSNDTEYFIGLKKNNTDWMWHLTGTQTDLFNVVGDPKNDSNCMVFKSRNCKWEAVKCDAKYGGICQIRDTNVCYVDNERCPTSLVCRPTALHQYNCSCPYGFWLEKEDQCTDVDECGQHNGQCDQQCENWPGSWGCGCDEGYTVNGRHCADIDECAIKNGDCHHRCNNYPGSWNCSCYVGFLLRADNVCDGLTTSEQRSAAGAVPWTLITLSGLAFICLCVLLIWRLKQGEMYDPDQIEEDEDDEDDEDEEMKLVVKEVYVVEQGLRSSTLEPTKQQDGTPKKTTSKKSKKKSRFLLDIRDNYVQPVGETEV